MNRQSVDRERVIAALKQLGFRRVDATSGTSHQAWVDGKGRRITPPLASKSVPIPYIKGIGTQIEGLTGFKRRDFVALVVSRPQRKSGG